MPTILELYGYRVFLWPNEGVPTEPIHFHVCKGDPSFNSAKVWITENGEFVIAKTTKEMTERKLRRLLQDIKPHAIKIATIYTAVTGCADFYEE